MSNELSIKSTNEIIFSSESMSQMQSLAKIMASSVATIPKHLQGNVGDCFAIAMQAAQWGMNPFAVAQKTHIVSGNLGYEAQLVNAVITSLAPIKGRLKFEWYGNWEKVIGNFKELESKTGQKYRKLNSTLADEKGCGVKVYGVLKDEDEPRVLDLLLSQAGVRNSTLWADDPKQQLAYLAIKRWSRLYCPDVIMGVYSPDELETINVEKEINPIEKNSSEVEKSLSCDDLLIKIKTMSVNDFRLIDPSLYSDDEKNILRKAMTDRKNEINSNVVADVSADIVEEIETEITLAEFPSAIAKCKNAQELTLLLNSSPEHFQIEFGELIDAMFDGFR